MGLKLHKGMAAAAFNKVSPRTLALIVIGAGAAIAIGAIFSSSCLEPSAIVPDLILNNTGMATETATTTATMATGTTTPSTDIESTKELGKNIVTKAWEVCMSEKPIDNVTVYNGFEDVTVSVNQKLGNHECVNDILANVTKSTFNI